MKFRKIISVLLAVGMMSNIATVMVHAAETKPELKAEVVKFENVDTNEVYTKLGASTAAGLVKQLGETGSAYLVKYTLTGIALEDASFGTGDKLMSVSVNYDTTNSSNLKMSLAQTYVAKPSIPVNSALKNGTYGLDKTDNGWYPPSETAVAAEETTDVLFGTLIVLTDDTVPVTFTPSATVKSEVITGSYSFGSYDGDSSKKYYTYSDSLTIAPFTLGAVAPAATLDRVVITGETTGLKMGATERTTLTATAYNTDDTVNNAATITWSVDNDVVTVDNDGVVTAKKAGTATVTATAVDGGITETASVEITVAPADPIVVTPSINVIGPDGEPVADITAAPGTAVTGSVDGKEVKGFVWPLVKLINFNAAGTYRATFTADDTKTAERTFDFSGIETIGKTDIEFAIVLNTNKTGVNLNMQYVAPSAE